MTIEESADSSEPTCSRRRKKQKVSSFSRSEALIERCNSAVRMIEEKEGEILNKIVKDRTDLQQIQRKVECTKEKIESEKEDFERHRLATLSHMMKLQVSSFSYSDELIEKYYGVSRIWEKEEDLLNKIAKDRADLQEIQRKVEFTREKIESEKEDFERHRLATLSHMMELGVSSFSHSDELMEKYYGVPRIWEKGEELLNKIEKDRAGLQEIQREVEFSKEKIESEREDFERHRLATLSHMMELGVSSSSHSDELIEKYYGVPRIWEKGEELLNKIAKDRADLQEIQRKVEFSKEKIESEKEDFERHRLATLSHMMDLGASSFSYSGELIEKYYGVPRVWEKEEELLNKIAKDRADLQEIQRKVEFTKEKIESEKEDFERHRLATLSHMMELGVSSFSHSDELIEKYYGVPRIWEKGEELLNKIAKDRADLQEIQRKVEFSKEKIESEKEDFERHRLATLSHMMELGASSFSHSDELIEKYYGVPRIWEKEGEVLEKIAKDRADMQSLKQEVEFVKGKIEVEKEEFERQRLASWLLMMKWKT